MKKYLILIILFYLFVLVRLDEDNDILIIGNNWCITNSSSAIVFNEDLSKSTDDSFVSFIYPQPPRTGYNCDFEKNGNCQSELWKANNEWEEQTSLYTKAPEIITDQRWENFPIVKTYGKLKTPLVYDQVLSDIYGNINIPLSIRIAKEAHIYLCDGYTPVDSNCYWIMLGMDNGHASKIRKCSKKQISSVYKVYPTEKSCKSGLKEVQVNPLDKNEWKHFLIQKYDGVLRIYHENQIFLEILDAEHWYSVANVFVHSKGVSGLWKIHNYDFLESTTISNYAAPLGPPMKIKQGIICISVFVKTSFYSSLTIRINNRGLGDLIIESISTNATWKQIQLFREMDPNRHKEEVLMYLTRKLNPGEPENEGYWAIDDVRQCHKEEFRYLTNWDENRKCQLISMKNQKTINLKTSYQKQTSSDGINCDEDRFGNACIPCEIFGNKFCTTGFKYCEWNEEKCHCAAGFTGNDCATECPQGFYGHGCRNVSHCISKNNPVTGECPQCEKPFEKPRCDKTSMPFFKNEPKVFDIDSTSFKVQQVNLDIVGNGSSYYFEYRKNNYLDWIADSNIIPVSKSPIIIIEHVTPDTEYLIRAIVINSAGESRSNEVKYSKHVFQFSTTCRQYDQDDIIIAPSNISTTITVQISLDNCKIYKYCYYISNRNCKPLFANVFTISNLKPHTEYTLVFNHSTRGSVSKLFKTTDGVPSVVQDIQHTSLTDSIMLSWKEPNEKNGELVGYEINYRSKNQACSDGAYGTFLSQNSSEKEITLNNLMPYNSYEINIKALTNDFKGEFKPIYVNTTQTTEISENEKIQILSINPGTRYFSFKLNEIPCNNITGPIKIKINLLCISKWCNDGNRTYQIFDYFENINNEVSQLQPYTNYTLILYISRNQLKWMFADSKNVQTKTDVPNSVSEFNVYTKDDKSISLRWIPPYLPTGVLKEYQISYSYQSKWTGPFGPYKKDISISDTRCQLWNEFHCSSITKNIYYNYIYTITISAKNVDPDRYGAKETISVATVEEGPEPPYGVSYNWTDNNELYIYWFHPNNTNGLLKSFEIIGDKQYSKFLHIDSENDYLLQYKIQYDVEFKPCEILELYIRSHNVHAASKSWQKIIIKNPPALPPNITFKYTSTNDTISLDISFPVPVQTIVILVSKSDKTDDMQLFEEGLRNQQVGQQNLTSSRIVYIDDKGLNSLLIFEIGNENNTSNNLPNPPLSAGTNYSITVILINNCNETTRRKIIQKYIITKGDPNLIDDEEEQIGEKEIGNGGLWALVLLLLIPLALYGIWYVKKNNLEFNQIIPPVSARTQKGDELPLTEKTPAASPRINVVKPKPTIVLPALQTKHSKKVPIIDFENYVKVSIENGELEKQHNLFPKGLLKPHYVGSLPENKNKNRYKNLIAYDHTRVKIKYDSNDGNDVGYINANYIDGYRKPRAYIATQGPKKNTLNDFWWMIWRENIKDLIMLANIHENGKKKVDKYWPDINEEKTYGSVKIQYVSETVFANFILRVFNVQFKTHERKVTQMHYTTWPDHGVPLYSQSLVPFLQRLLKIPHNSQTPILVHCSAGVGRTGTIILSDICLRMAAGEGSLDFLAHLENLRNQRANLVDNIEQYKLAHLVVLECLFGMRTSIPCTDDMGSIVTATLNNNGIKTQMKYILDTQWQDLAMETMLESDEVAPIYNEKNRVKDIVPDNYRVYVTRYPHEDEKSSYINAVFVDDFSNPGRYIATQQPLPNTLGDFWRLVLERSCSVIISLNTINLDDQTVCQIWPEKGEELNPVDFIKLIHKKTQRLNFYKIITVQMEIKQAKHSLVTDGIMEVNIIALDNWRSEDLLPNSIEEFLAFRDAADALARTCEKVIVTCYDGAKASGLYLALSFLIEQMKLEQECDVCLAVRSIRHSRKQFVTTEEQYEFLYRAAVAFISGFQPYSNFS